ncbi:MAG TPA: hypothetical protein VLS53_07680, partial [Candidatus Dormibacteraeota bacterium]|nr:hypothetical protein [Candidatus Dormibacteraeota bacterium]
DNYRFELLAASAEGSSRTVVDRQWKGGQPAVTPEVFGWDASGPLATAEAELGSQQGTQGRVLWGHAVHLDAAGAEGPVVGGTDCNVVQIVSGRVLCADDRFVSYSVRTAAGSTLWSLPQLPQGQYYAYVVLSPDGSHLAFSGGVRGRDGSSIPLPQNFNPEGWLDNATLIGITGENNQQEMATLRLDSPGRINDLGFKGEFIGVLAAP